MTKAIKFSQPSHGRRNGLTLPVISLLLSVVVSIAGCQSGGQVEPDDPTDAGGNVRGPSCPAMIDASCFPRGNASNRNERVANWTAHLSCIQQRLDCQRSQFDEMMNNMQTCIAASCSFNMNNIEDPVCTPTQPGQPCFFRPGTGMNVCSYKSEVNYTDYTCE